MAKPNKTLEWIPDDNVALIIQPPLGVQSAGFTGDTKPLAQHFNYTWNMISKWVGWLKTSKFDLDNTLQSVLYGVDFADVSTNIQKSSVLGYSAIPGRFDEIIAIGYKAVMASDSIPAGSTIIGVSLVNGVDFTNPTFAIGYNEYLALVIDYTLKQATADFSLSFTPTNGIDSHLQLAESLYMLADGTSTTLPAETLASIADGGWRFYHEYSGSSYEFILKFYNANTFRIQGPPIYAVTDGWTIFEDLTDGNTQVSWFYDDIDDASNFFVGTKALIQYLFATSKMRIVHQDYDGNAFSGIFLDDGGNINLDVFGGSGLGTARVNASVGGELCWETWFGGNNDKHTRFTKRLTMQAPFNDSFVAYDDTDIVDGGVTYRSSILIDISADVDTNVYLTHIKKSLATLQDFKHGDRIRLAYKKRVNQNLIIGYPSGLATAPTGFNVAEDALILAQGTIDVFATSDDYDRIILPTGFLYGVLDLQMVDDSFINAWDSTATKVFTTSLHTYAGP